MNKDGSYCYVCMEFMYGETATHHKDTKECVARLRLRLEHLEGKVGTRKQRAEFGGRY